MKHITVRQYGEDIELSKEEYIDRWTASICDLRWILKPDQYETIRKQVVDGADKQFEELYEKESK